jgi:polyisoprenoid-binding protein YceI
MKNTIKIILACIIISSNAMAQNYICQGGETGFFSETPLENIVAINKNVASVINISTNDIAVKMTMTDFKFQNHLMGEHFNENYMESAKYPTGVFKGKINETIDWKKNGTYDITAKGTLAIHGVGKERTLTGKLTIEGEKITLISNFDIPLKDHKIDIPTVVVAKIAENISVKNKFIFVPLKK